jgi:hypothetical protein
MTEFTVRVRALDIAECRSMDELYEVVKEKLISAGVPPGQWEQGTIEVCRSRYSDAQHYTWTPKRPTGITEVLTHKGNA